MGGPYRYWVGFTCAVRLNFHLWWEDHRGYLRLQLVGGVIARSLRLQLVGGMIASG